MVKVENMPLYRLELHNDFERLPAIQSPSYVKMQTEACRNGFYFYDAKPLYPSNITSKTLQMNVQ